MTVHPFPQEPVGRPQGSLPAFEGKPVSRTTLKLVSVVGLEIDDEVLHTDDIIHLEVEAVVNGVSHEVDPKDGSLVRVHRAKVLDLKFQPWDGEDPTDRGIARS